MIIVDTSILVAIILEEPDALLLSDAIADALDWAIPANCYLETAVVLARTVQGREALDRLLGGAVRMVPIDESVARLAADAFARYGRRSGHPACLGFGDCLSYAVARSLDAPLLFKGGDFALTDVTPAI